MPCPYSAQAVDRIAEVLFDPSKLGAGLTRCPGGVAYGRFKVLRAGATAAPVPVGARLGLEAVTLGGQASNSSGGFVQLPLLRRTVRTGGRSTQMAQYVLEILDGDRAGTVVSLGEDPVRIGRKSENDLVLADEKVSGCHAEVVWEEGRYVLRDLGSTNGTLLDGRPVEEVVLTAQDLFQIGRIHLSFHKEGQEAGGDFRLRRVSAEDLSRSGRSTRWMVGLVGALVLGGGALYYNLYVGPGPIRRSLEARRGPLEVPRNRLAQDQASCETQEGWDLRVAGDGFDYGPQAYTGTQGLQAWAVEDGTGFALARLSEGVKVRGSLVVTAYVRTEGSGQIAVRLRFSSSLVDQSQAFTTGIEPRAYGEYHRVEWQVAVPPGTDLAEVELLALLPELGDAAFADDLAIVESGDREPINLRQGGRLLGTASSFAVRLSGEPVIAGARPLVVDGPLAPVAAAGFATLSDAGVAVRVEAGPRAITLGFVGGAGLVLDLPMGSSQGILARRGEAPFVQLGPTARADEILIGVGTGRVLLELPL